MILIPRTLLRRLAIGLAGGLAALPLICAGNGAARAQPAGAAWNAGAMTTAPQLPPALPQPLQAPTLTPLCCAPVAPAPQAQTPPAAAAPAPAVAAPAATPSRRN